MRSGRAAHDLQTTDPRTPAAEIVLRRAPKERAPKIYVVIGRRRRFRQRRGERVRAA
jgi:hypothetical protein